MEDKRIYDYFEKYTFLCDTYNVDKDEIQELVLHYFPYDDSVQVIDVEKNKTLLKRVLVPGINKKKLQIGNIINIFSKLLLLRDCAPITRKVLYHNVKSTFALIKPVSPKIHGKIITFIMKHGFRIMQMKNGKIGPDLASEIYEYMSSDHSLPYLIQYVTSGEVIGLELQAEDAVRRWRDCLGATDPQHARPGTLRHMFGENHLRNIAHGSHSQEDADNIIQNFFGHHNGKPNISYCATFKDCTCCVIKPHVFIDGNVGQIIETIVTSKYFYIAAMATFTVSLDDAKEFYEIYKGVLPEYHQMCTELCEGQCIALEIKNKNPSTNVVCEFRKFCGVRDPDISRVLYPESLRALYGKSIVQNAVHCSDLPEEGELEVEYFFKLLGNKRIT